MCDTINIFGLFTISGYGLMIAIGVLCLAIFITYQFRRHKVSEKNIDKLIFLTAFCGLIMYLSASFFDNLWHSIAYYQQHGVWKWIKYGITYSGGLLGAVAAYFAAYFLVFPKQKYNYNFYINIIIQGVILTHAFGRVGCYCGGCCYGAPTDAWYGVKFPGMSHAVVPVMLFEAAFLFILFIVMVLFVKKHQLRYYFISYGIWRFIIEFFRGDDRGGVILGMSPSQFLSVIMIILAIILWIFEDKWAEALYIRHLKKYPDEPVQYFYPNLDKINVNNDENSNIDILEKPSKVITEENNKAGFIKSFLSDFGKPDFSYFKEYIKNMFKKKEKKTDNKENPLD